MPSKWLRKKALHPIPQSLKSVGGFFDSNLSIINSPVKLFKSIWSINMYLWWLYKI